MVANMWTQQTTISSVIICTTASGILFYAGTIIVSMLRPDSPFQTPGSEAMKAIWKKYFPDRSTSTLNDTSIKLTAMRWILETSTNPKVVEAAAGMVPLIQWPQKFDPSAIYARLRDNFVACRDNEEVFVKCGKAMAHLWGQSLDIRPDLGRKSRYTWDCWGGKSRFIRDAFMDSRDAYTQLINAQQQTTWQILKADTRTALRTMVVHGIPDRFSLPDDEYLIWHGDLRWWRHSDGLMPRCEEFDWLIDYLADEASHEEDEETEGDALLALSAMHGLGSSVKRRSYITTLIHCMGPTKPPRVRHAALRAISNAREELASITNESMPEGVDATLLDRLSYAILTAVRPDQDQTFHDGPDASFHHDRDRRYASIIFALTMNDEWRDRLTRDGHLQRCTHLVEANSRYEPWILGCYLAGIFTWTDPSKMVPSSPAQERWQTLVRTMWKRALTLPSLDAIPDLVTVTSQNLGGVNSAPELNELTDLAGDVHEVLELLQGIQGLDNDLRCMIDNLKTSSRDDDGPGSLGS
ncbi:hypothetical protein F4604DRAFT_1285155 [Suillus subluteus]|nr:hypothetical protein F4604DRAFT_1285155 [Suillus subluteus]